MDADRDRRLGVPGEQMRIGIAREQHGLEEHHATDHTEVEEDVAATPCG